MGKVVTRRALVGFVARSLGITNLEAAPIVRAIFEIIIESLNRGEQVRTPIGIFRRLQVRKKKRTWIQTVRWFGTQEIPVKRLVREKGREVIFLPDPELNIQT